MKNVFFLMLILVANQVFCQAVVSAPVTEKLLIKQSIESKANFLEEMAELKKQTDVAKEIKEKLMKVASQIRQGRKAVNVGEKSAQVFDLLEKSLKELDQSRYPSKIKKKPISILNDLLRDAETISEDITNVLTSGIFRMSDSERLSFLDNLDQKLDDVKFNIYSTMRSAHRYGRLYASYSKK